MNTATAQMEKEFPIHKAPYQSNNKKRTKGRIQARSNIQSVPIYEIDEISKNRLWASKKLIGYRHIQHKR